MGLVDQILVFNPKTFAVIAMLRLAKRLRGARPSVFFDLQIHTHRRLARRIAWLSGASRRFGFFRPREALPRSYHGIYANPFAPVDQLYREMAQPFGSATAEPLFNHSLAISGADDSRAAALLHGWRHSGERLLIVNPNASETAYVRRWPIAHYSQAIAALLRAVPGLKVALIGSDTEADYVQSLAATLPTHGKRVRNFAGLTSLGSLMALLVRADCLLSNDSGPLHLALALEVPVVGLFGPVHPNHNAQLGHKKRKIILYKPMLCSPCVHYASPPPCGGDNRCMTSIAPQHAVDACLSFLSDRHPRERDSLSEWHFDDAMREGALMSMG
jgi:ADP-heptose:LPS heptosyltransferase